MPLPTFTLVESQGRVYRLNDYNNHVLLIVNTATSCGFKSQFKGLEALYQEFKDKDFTVLGFPSNQFKQEKVPDEIMVETCHKNHGVTFPLNVKINVNGEETDPLYQWLKGERGGLFNSDIKWNFTKFLLNRQGCVVKRYPPTTAPEKIRKDILALL